MHRALVRLGEQTEEAADNTEPATTGDTVVDLQKNLKRLGSLLRHAGAATCEQKQTYVLFGVPAPWLRERPSRHLRAKAEHRRARTSATPEMRLPSAVPNEPPTAPSAASGPTEAPHARANVDTSMMAMDTGGLCARRSLT